VQKRCFSYWHQGWENAPEVVRICAASFKKFHPDWDYQQLDQHTVVPWLAHDDRLKQLLPECGHSLTHAQCSNLIRMSLLEYYGGVWADATVLFVKSMNVWLAEYAEHGFFAFPFSQPNVYPISTWFLYADAGAPLLVRINRAYRQALFALLESCQLKSVDYYFFHQVIAKCLAEDDMCADFWRQCPKFPSRDCSKFNYHDVDVATGQLLLERCPLFKLNHMAGKVQKDILQDEGLLSILQALKLSRF